MKVKKHLEYKLLEDKGRTPDFIHRSSFMPPEITQHTHIFNINQDISNFHICDARQRGESDPPIQIKLTGDTNPNTIKTQKIYVLLLIQTVEPDIKDCFVTGSGAGYEIVFPHPPEPSGESEIEYDYEIEDICINCYNCYDVCPIDAIDEGEPFNILEEVCINCGKCYGVCPVDAITRTPQNMDLYTGKLPYAMQCLVGLRLGPYLSGDSRIHYIANHTPWRMVTALLASVTFEVHKKEESIPDWSAGNAPYKIKSTVKHQGNVWISMVNHNNDIPSDSSGSWLGKIEHPDKDDTYLYTPRIPLKLTISKVGSADKIVDEEKFIGQISIPLERGYEYTYTIQADGYSDIMGNIPFLTSAVTIENDID